MGLLDIFKNKKRDNTSSVLPSKNYQLTKEFNLDQMNYYSKLLENPDSTLKKLGKDVKVYDEIMSDPHVYACVQSRKSGVMSKEWGIDQYESDKSVMDFVENMFNKLDVTETTNAILDAPLFGYQPIEIVWDLVDGKYIPIKLHKRPRNYFKFDIDRNLVFIDDFGNDEVVPQLKFIVPSNEASKDNPYGIPVLSKCYWPVVLKNDVRKYWTIFSEKFGMPWVKINYAVARYDDKDKVNELVALINSQVQDATFALPSDIELDLMNGANVGSSGIYQDFIKECKEDISEVLLGHTSATSSTPGKLGNEGMAISVVDRIIDADKRLVEKTFNQLIKMAVDLNFTTDLYPHFRFFDEENINKERAERDAILAGIGVKFSKEYLMREYNFYEEDFELVELSAAIGGSTNAKKSDNPSDKLNIGLDVLNNANVFNSESDSKEQKLADDFMNEIMEPKKTDKMFNKVLKPIFDYAKKTELSKMDKDYYKLFKKLDSNEFNTLIERAMFVLHLHGDNSVQIDIDDDSNSTNVDYYNKGELFTLKELLLSLEKEPEEIVKYFESKGVAVSSNWKETLDIIRNHAFTVSGVVKMDILMDFKEMITKAISEGLSQSEFNKQLRENFETKGWLGKKTENNKLVESWRLGVIYRTNLQSAFMDGRWNNHTLNINLRPYVQCSSIIDPSTTKECKALNNKVFRVDDKYFAQHLRPPGHYQCRRETVSLSEKLLKKRGLSVTKGSTMSKYRNAKGFDNKGEVWIPDESKYEKELWKEYEKAS
jgi:SPP1 gp7 family putative phage head morphogenesis protein